MAPGQADGLPELCRGGRPLFGGISPHVGRLWASCLPRWDCPLDARGSKPTYLHKSPSPPSIRAWLIGSMCGLDRHLQPGPWCACFAHDARVPFYMAELKLGNATPVPAVGSFDDSFPAALDVVRHIRDLGKAFRSAWVHEPP